MTTKTIHRIPAKEVVIEDDRRILDREFNIETSPDGPENKIIYVPVEPHLLEVSPKYKNKEKRISNEKGYFSLYVQG